MRGWQELLEVIFLAILTVEVDLGKPDLLLRSIREGNESPLARDDFDDHGLTIDEGEGSGRSGWGSGFLHGHIITRKRPFKQELSA